MICVLLVHGAFHGAWCWEPLQVHLDRAGVESVAIDLPLTSCEADEDAVRQAVGALTDDGAQAVVVGHSYGGNPVTGGATSATVVHLIYVASLLAETTRPTTATTGAISGADDLPAAPTEGALVFSGDRVTIDPDRGPAIFYGHCDTADRAWAMRHVRATPAALFGGTPSAAAWRDRPSTYVLCRDDLVLAPAVQRQQARRATDVVELTSDHSPFLSHPQELAGVLTAVVARYSPVIASRPPAPRATGAQGR